MGVGLPTARADQSPYVRAMTRLSRPSPATVIALLALVAATAPQADAATRAVKRALVADNAKKVGGVKVSKTPKARTLLPLVVNGKFPASVVPAGAAGRKDPRARKGRRVPPALTGAPATADRRGATSVKTRLSVTLPIPANDSRDLTAVCQPGERAVGGGARLSGSPDFSDPADTIMSSFPGVAVETLDPLEPWGTQLPTDGETPNAWRVNMHNPAGNPSRNMTVYVVCAAP